MTQIDICEDLVKICLRNKTENQIRSTETVTERVKTVHWTRNYLKRVYQDSEST